jgi:4-hydroxy-tetrahydrodipicolinate synthase
MENFGMRLNEFKLWTALVTPLNDDGSISIVDLKKLLKRQESAENGIVVLGSTGEALNLSLDERKLVVQTTVAMKLKVPVMVGVAGHDLSSVLDWLSFLEGVAIDAYLMVTPIYSKPGAEGQYQWFKSLLDNVSRPSMLYNVPGRTACALNTDAVTRLSAHDNFWAIKESGGSVESFLRYSKSVTKGYVYCGDDPLLPDFVPFGSTGLVSVASNIWPKETHAYVELALRNELNQKDLFIWKTASNALFIASNPVPAKALLALVGQIASATVKLPLHQDDMKSPEVLIEASKMVRNWYANCRYSGRLKTLKKNKLEIA